VTLLDLKFEALVDRVADTHSKAKAKTLVEKVLDV